MEGKGVLADESEADDDIIRYNGGLLEPLHFAWMESSGQAMPQRARLGRHTFLGELVCEAHILVGTCPFKTVG